jgi:hypothetical protein
LLREKLAQDLPTLAARVTALEAVGVTTLDSTCLLIPDEILDAKLV